MVSEDIIKYVMHSPHNTNPAILKNKLNALGANWDAAEGEAGFIKNRPFYDTRKSEGVVITYDGKPEGKETILIDVPEVPTGKMTLVKIADKVPTINDCVGGNYLITIEEQSFSGVVEQDHVESASNNNFVLELVDTTGLFIIQNETTLGDFLQIPSLSPECYDIKIPSGVWTMFIEGMPQLELIFTYEQKTGELKQIDPKFVYDAIIEHYWSDNSFTLVHGSYAALYEKMKNFQPVNVIMMDNEGADGLAHTTTYLPSFYTFNEFSSDWPSKIYFKFIDHEDYIAILEDNSIEPFQMTAPK